MSDFIVKLLPNLVTALISIFAAGFLAHALTKKRDELDAKGDFRAVVKKVIWRFCREDDLIAIYKDYVADIATEYYRVRRFIGRDTRADADKAWQEYYTMDKKEENLAPNFKAVEMKEDEILNNMYEALQVTHDPAHSRHVVWANLEMRTGVGANVARMSMENVLKASELTLRAYPRAWNEHGRVLIAFHKLLVLVVFWS